MTLAVFAFQAFIFISMCIAAFLGKRWLTTATVLWSLFTLFGSIFTMGLMALQLITIYFSYNVSASLFRTRWARLR